MALINNAYGAIITKGLGFPACCYLLTAPFGLACGCEITPVPPNVGTGGSTPVYLTPLVVPLGQRIDTNTRLVILTIKHRENLKWKKEYIISKRKAAILVEVLNFVNAVKDKTAITVSNLKQAALRVIAKVRNKYPDNKE